MSYKELKDAYKQAKSRERVRSTFFEDEPTKMAQRQQRRLSEKKEVEVALDTELQDLEDLDNYWDEYSVDDEQLY